MIGQLSIHREAGYNIHVGVSSLATLRKRSSEAFQAVLAPSSLGYNERTMRLESITTVVS